MKKGVANREKRCPRRQYGDPMITRLSITGETFIRHASWWKPRFSIHDETEQDHLRKENKNVWIHHLFDRAVLYRPAVHPSVLWVLSPLGLSFWRLQQLEYDELYPGIPFYHASHSHHFGHQLHLVGYELRWQQDENIGCNITIVRKRPLNKIYVQRLLLSIWFCFWKWSDCHMNYHNDIITHFTLSFSRVKLSISNWGKMGILNLFLSLLNGNYWIIIVIDNDYCQ